MDNIFTKKPDALVAAVTTALVDSDLFRQAESIVNEHYGVYSRKALIHEDIAGYDADVQEVYQSLKEGCEGTKKDKEDDKQLAKKHHMSLSKWERSAQDKKHDQNCHKEDTQLDELSKDTLRSYIAKSSDDLQKRKKAVYTNKFSPKGEKKKDHESNLTKFHNRAKGIDRAWKKVDEDTQLDEISQGVLKSYIKKAGIDKQSSMNDKKSPRNDREEIRSLNKNIRKRTIGLNRAMDRASPHNRWYVGEDTQLDELSRDTLNSYIKKAFSSRASNERENKDLCAKIASGKEDTGGTRVARMRKGINRQVKNRNMGIGRAVYQLNKEDIQLDEISKKLATNYLKKQRGDADFYRKQIEKSRDEYDKNAKSYNKAVKAKSRDNVKTKFKNRMTKAAHDETDNDRKAANREIGFHRALGKLTNTSVYKTKGSGKNSPEKVRVLAKEESQLDELSSFGRAFASARKAGSQEFKFNGKSFHTRLKGESPSKPASAGSKPADSKPDAKPEGGSAFGNQLPKMRTQPGTDASQEAPKPTYDAPVTPKAGSTTASAPAKPDTFFNKGVDIAAKTDAAARGAQAASMPPSERNTLPTPPDGNKAGLPPTKPSSLKEEFVGNGTKVKVGNMSYKLV